MKSNEFGDILVKDTVIANYVGIAVNETSGVVGTCALNIKDGIYKLLKKENITDGIHISIINNKVFVNVHIVVLYGIPIPNITDSLLNTINYFLRDYIGIRNFEITIFVEKVKITDVK